MGEAFLIAWTSEHVAAIDDEVDTGGESAFVAPKIDRHRRDFLCGAEPAHLLAGDEFLASIRASGGRAPEHRRRLDGAGADAVAADALRDEVERNRARQQRNRRFGRTVDITVGRWPQRRARRDVDNAAASAR